jgi:hypothetical protein
LSLSFYGPFGNLTPAHREIVDMKLIPAKEFGADKTGKTFLASFKAIAKHKASKKR